MADFEGVYPALATPMSADGALNESVLAQIVEFNIQAGVHGFWVAGGTGESILLGDDENAKIAEITMQQAAGRAKIIMHVGASTTARAASMAEEATKYNVDAICCVPPFFYGRSPDEIAEHYRVVAAAADVPLFVYNLPSATGVEITPPLMQTIQDRVPQLKGLKHSAPAVAHVHTFAGMGLDCFIGNCRLMLPAMTIGAIGCVDGPPNMLPELWVDVWEAYQARDLDRAEAAQKAANLAYDRLSEGGVAFHALVKGVLTERLGVDCGDPRPPGLPMTSEQRAEIGRIVSEMELETVQA